MDLVNSTNINGVRVWCVTFQGMGRIALGIKSRTLHFCVLQRSMFKLNLLLETKYSEQSSLKEGSAPGLSLLASKPTFAKLNIYFVQLNSFNDRIFLVLYFGFPVRLLFFLTLS